MLHCPQAYMIIKPLLIANWPANNPPRSKASNHTAIPIKHYNQSGVCICVCIYIYRIWWELALRC